MMKKGIARFTAFCMAAGMTFGGRGIVSYATGTDIALVGVSSTTSASVPAETESETQQTEAEMTQSETETTVPEDAAAEAGESADAAAETETATETEVETEAALDTSMVNTTGFAKCNEYVNIRSTPDIEGEVIGKLANNAAVYILSVDENGWYKIQSGNAEGYVASQYIATGALADETASEVGYQVAEVGAEVLNVRAEASQDSEIITTVTNTQEVEVVEDYGEWLKVAVDSDCYGYVSADYVNTETYYKVAETVEEEQARLEAEYQAYLEEQAQAEAEYQAYLDAQAAQAAADAAAQAQAEADAAYQAQQQAQAEADAAYQAQLDAQAAADAAAQQTVDAQAQAEAQYQAYLDAQAAADAATQQADEQAVIDTAAEAQAQYQAYLEAQAAADAQAQAEADAAAQAQAEADAAAQAQAEAEAAAQAQAEADAAAQAQAEAEAQESQDYYEESYEDVYVEDTTDNGSYEDTSSSYSAGQSIVDYAVQFVGNPYVYGGTSLTNGADCSGFTQSVFANFGIGLPRTAAEQYNSGTPVDLSQIQAGDLLFYSNGGGIGHVSIYMGNGQVVHASSSTTGIIISDYGYRTPVGARRYW